MRVAALTLVFVLAGACTRAPAGPSAPPEAPPTPSPIATRSQPAPGVPDVPDEPDEPELPWPPGVPPLPGARVIEAARISANVGDSPAGATYVTAPGDVHAVARAWVASAQAAGYRVLAERTHGRVHVASLIDAAGKRAHLLVQTEDEARAAGMFAFGVHPQQPLAGKCVDLPLRTRGFSVDRGAITHDGGYRRGVYEVHVDSQLGHDFDGDGELDAIVPTTDRATCPEDARWTVYLARGACVHAVGTVGPGALITWDLQTDRPGPRPIVMQHDRAELGDGGVIKTAATTTYTFDRKRSKYVQTSREDTRGVCHHCAWGECKPLP